MSEMQTIYFEDLRVGMRETTRNEVTQEKVRQPQDVKTRLLAVRKSGRRSVLLLLSDGKGELRFVAVPSG